MPGADFFVVVDDVIDADRCQALVARIESLPHEATRVRGTFGAAVDAGRRNNTRVWFDDFDLAAHLFRALRAPVTALVRGPALLHLFRNQHATSCESTFRGYRYRVGERFAPHVDATFVADDGTRTLLTVLVYLNDDVDGGETRFPDDNFGVSPRVGRVCVFPHDVRHEGVVVTRGTKYALRTNVFFAPG